jgi:xanthine/uracil permease
MHRNTAGILFLIVSALLSFMLLTRMITPLVSGSIFAAALVVLGLLSRGFTRED